MRLIIAPIAISLAPQGFTRQGKPDYI